MNLIDKIDLDLAWKRVKNDSKSDFILLSYLFQSYDRYDDENLKNLKEKIDNGYKVTELWEIDVPKPHFVLRPGTVPKIEDRIYYQALVDSIAPEVEKKLIPIADNVLFSYRLSENIEDPVMFQHTSKLWSDFEQKVRDNQSNGQTVLALTDIVGYYENIDHNILKECLLRFGCDLEIVSQLYDLLKSWKRTTGINRGIPQGLWPSHLLGNIYLDSVDKYMLRHGYNYFRYVDDIRISCASIPEARKALKTLVEELRRLNLSVQTKKTVIYAGDKVNRYIDELSERMSRIQEEVREAIKEDIAEEKLADAEDDYIGGLYSGSSIQYSDIEEAAIEEYQDIIENESLRKFYEDAIKDKFPTAKHLRFCLNRLSRLNDDIAITKAVELLRDMPYESNTIVLYLKNFPDHEEIREKIIDFLKTDYNIYEWQEMWLLEYFFSCKTLLDKEIDFIWHIIENYNKHEAVRIRAILLLGRTGKPDHLERLRNLYDKEKDEYIKISIIVGLRSYDKGHRNYFYGLCKGQSTFIDQAINYMKEIT